MDLSTRYLGLTLRSPIVTAASPLTMSIENIARMDEAGAGAIVMHSLFEEQIEQESRNLDHYLTFGAESFYEAISYFPDLGNYNVGPDEYLELIRKAKETVSCPVIGSLNGVSTGGWTSYAKKIQEAGADALELNLYYIPTDPRLTGAEVEEMYLQVVRDIKKAVTIPVAFKMAPYYTSTANMAKRLVDAGADGLVLFNRFYQPDFDLEKLEVVPSLHLSTSHDLKLPLRWAAILYGRVAADLAITSGVHTHEDVLKGLMAGAKVTQMAAELLKNGIGRIKEIELAMREWMEVREYESVTQMQGSLSQKHCAEPAAFERANYMKALASFKR